MFSLVETWPDIPSSTHMFMLEAMTFKSTVQVVPNSSIHPDDISVQAWTNIYHRENPEGEWHPIQLKYMDNSWKDADGTAYYQYGDSITLTSYGDAYRFTFRIRHAVSSTDTDWLWAGGYMVDGKVRVSPPTHDKWTQGPEYDEIMNGVCLGNFMAAAVADKLGFDAVLNVADNLDLVDSKFVRPVLYKKVAMMDGAMNPIPEHRIAEAINWLLKHANSSRKILVNCRAGIGRAGSTVVGFVFASNPSLSYEECYKLVFLKRFVYPHKRLKETLYKLYPRK